MIDTIVQCVTLVAEESWQDMFVNWMNYATMVILRNYTFVICIIYSTTKARTWSFVASSHSRGTECLSVLRNLRTQGPWPVGS